MKAIKSKLLYFALSIFLPALSLAQTIKIRDFSELEVQAKKGSDTLTNIAKYSIGAVFAIGALYLIYAISSQNPRAKEYTIAYFIGLIIYLIIFNTILG